jgi:glycine cleavage system aminomethyltransferase T
MTARSRATSGWSRKGPDRHLREGQPQHRLGGSLPLGGRERAVRGRLRPGHALAGGKPEPHADLCRSGHHPRRAWRDQPPARRQPADRPGAGRAQLLVLLRHADRHRLGAGADPRTGALDGAWRRRHLDARLRSAPLRAYATKDWQVVKAKEDYCLRHEIPFPHFNRLAGRPVKPSPLYETAEGKGAVFEEVYGFERPRWFAGRRGAGGSLFLPPHGGGRHGRRRGARRCASAPGSWMSAFTKVLVEGPDAYALLDRLVANRMPQKVGRHHADPHAEPARPDRAGDHHRAHGRGPFYLVCAAFFEQRLLDHLAAHRRGEDVTVTALSDSWGALALNGPRARDVLAACTDARLDNAAFRWLSAQEIEVAGPQVWAFRMSYAGELGWELHMPARPCRTSTTRSGRPARPHGIADYGSFAMNVMRMEKGFKGAGELTNEVTLAEADVMRFARTDKDYLGRDKTLNTAICPGSAPIWRSSRTAKSTAMAARRCCWTAGRRLDRLGGLWPHGRQDPRLRLCQTRGRDPRHRAGGGDPRQPRAAPACWANRPMIRKACCRAPMRPHARPPSDRGWRASRNLPDLANEDHPLSALARAADQPRDLLHGRRQDLRHGDHRGPRASRPIGPPAGARSARSRTTCPPMPAASPRRSAGNAPVILGRRSGRRRGGDGGPTPGCPVTSTRNPRWTSRSGTSPARRRPAAPCAARRTAAADLPLYHSITCIAPDEMARIAREAQATGITPVPGQARRRRATGGRCRAPAPGARGGRPRAAGLWRLELRRDLARRHPRRPRGRASRRDAGATLRHARGLRPVKTATGLPMKLDELAMTRRC